MNQPLSFSRTPPRDAAAALLLAGWQRRCTATEPRLSEIVAEYRRIGFEVQVLPHAADPGDCQVCFEDGALAEGGAMDVFVRRGSAAAAMA